MTSDKYEEVHDGRSSLFPFLFFCRFHMFISTTRDGIEAVSITSHHSRNTRGKDYGMLEDMRQFTVGFIECLPVSTLS